MANPDYAQMPLRLSKLEMGRLEQDAKKRRISKNEFTRRALAAAFADSDGGKYMAEVQYEAANSTSDEEPRRVEKSSGLSLKSLFSTINQTRDPSSIASEPTTPAPMIINNNIGGATTPTEGSFVDKLANYVVAGRDFERVRHTQVAVDIIKANVASEEEQERLARQLDEAIEKKGKRSETSMLQAARMTFDKLSSLFGREAE